MPNLTEHGIGECNHIFQDGKCWFCGESEVETKESNSAIERLNKLIKENPQSFEDAILVRDKRFQDFMEKK